LAAIDVATDFASLFVTFQRSAFRLETRNRYAVPEEVEPFRRFCDGERPGDEWTREWTDAVRVAVRAGKRMQRVHVVTEPLTRYLRFELTCGYPNNIAAGEEINILAVRRDDSAPLLPDDFWLFDDEAVGAMRYDDDGRFLGVEVLTDSATISRYRSFRDVALRLAMPFAAYLPRLTREATTST